jgi:hypothetical protein
MVAGLVYQQRMAWVECARILGHRTRPTPQGAFAAVNVPTGRAAGIGEPAGVGKGIWGANQIQRAQPGLRHGVVCCERCQTDTLWQENHDEFVVLELRIEYAGYPGSLDTSPWYGSDRASLCLLAQHTK